MRFGYVRPLGLQPLVAVWDQCDQFIYLICQTRESRSCNRCTQCFPWKYMLDISWQNLWNCNAELLEKFLSAYLCESHQVTLLKVILSQDSIYGVKSSSQCAKQILKLTQQDYMHLWPWGGVRNFSSPSHESKSSRLKYNDLKLKV